MRKKLDTNTDLVLFSDTFPQAKILVKVTS